MLTNLTRRSLSDRLGRAERAPAPSRDLNHDSRDPSLDDDTTLEWSNKVVFYYHSPRVLDAGVTPLDSLTNTFL